jgi:hypothetical protein
LCYKYVLTNVFDLKHLNSTHNDDMERLYHFLPSFLRFINSFSGGMRGVDGGGENVGNGTITIIGRYPALGPPTLPQTAYSKQTQP